MMNIIEIYKKYIKTTVFRNILSLGLLQMANYIIPIIIIPFVVRALGVESFGKVSYAQNIIAYLTILVNYGFEYSATQDIAINRDNKKTLNLIFWAVVRVKIFLLFLSFVVLGILYYTSSKVYNDALLYFYAALINIGFVLFPTWFFQGIEKMGKMSIFNFAIKGIGALLTILIIHTPSDYNIYALILSLSYIFVGIISFWYVIKKYNLFSISNDKKIIFAVIKKGFPIFFNNVFTTLYAIAGVTIIGLYLTEKDVGLYVGGQKIIQAIIMLTCMPLSISFFPKMSRLFNDSRIEARIFFKKILIGVIIIGIILSCFLFFISHYIVSAFLGKEFLQIIDCLKLMSIIPMLVLIATIMTVQGLYGFQCQKYVPIVGFFAGGTSLVVCFLTIPVFGIYGAVYAWIAAQFVEIIFDSILLLFHIKS